MTERTTTPTPTRQTFLIVFVILAVFTAMEVGVTFLTGLPDAVKAIALVVLAVTKVGLVLLYFMQLRFDPGLFAMPFVLGLILAVPIILIVTLAIPGSTASLGQGAAQSESSSTTINVSETSYQISLDANSAPAGQVTFHVTNDAANMTHEFLVVKSDQQANNLPTDGKGNVDENQVQIMDEISDLAPGQSQDLSLKLEAGHYVVLCNLPGHYQQGMYADFTVSGQGGGGGSTDNGTGTNATEEANPRNTQSTQNDQTAQPTATSEGSSGAAGQNATGETTSSGSTGEGSQGATVEVTETSYQIDLSTDNAPAGAITFQVSNRASNMPHELLVIKTDQKADKLPTDDSGNLNEDNLNIIGSVEDIPAGQSKTLTVNLEPGHYVLVCNLPGHYQQGMYTDFTVKNGETRGTSTANATSTEEATLNTTGSTTTTAGLPGSAGVQVNINGNNNTINVITLVLPSNADLSSILASVVGQAPQSTGSTTGANAAAPTPTSQAPENAGNATPTSSAPASSQQATTAGTTQTEATEIPASQSDQPTAEATIAPPFAAGISGTGEGATVEATIAPPFAGSPSPSITATPTTGG